MRDAECVDVIDPPDVDVGLNNVDDFEVDLCQPLNTNLSDTEKLLLDHDGKKDYVEPRCSKELLVRCKNLDAAHPDQLTLKGSSANEGSTLEMPRPKFKEQMESDRTSPAKQLAMENSDMPSELKCSLCRTFFKEAVMIPCCQHSFCGKCIRLALSENAKCPMCSSAKCKAEDLLPNVSLRQAIERFLESQLLLNGSENDLHRYAPDGESGIQVKDISYATSVPQRHLQLSHSATWNRSNQIKQSKLHDHAHFADKCNPGTFENFSDFQGENDPQSMAGTNEGANSCYKNGEGSRIITRGGERNFTAPGRPSKGPRTCYMCGSPDHLFRDCPGTADSSTSFNWNGVPSFPGAVSGYSPAYWPGSPHSRPFVNMYGGPGMMFYNTNAAPISPFAFPPCAPSMYGGYPLVSGYMNAGGMAPPPGNFSQQPRHEELLNLQGCARQQRNCDVDLGRERIIDREHNANTHHDSMERGLYHADDSFVRRSEGKHRSRDNSDGGTYSNCNRQAKVAQKPECGRDIRISQSDRISLEKDVLDSRIRPRDDGHEKLHRTLRRDDDIGSRHGRDSAQKYYQSNKEISKRKRMEHNERKSDGHSHSRSRSSLERSYSGDGARQRREESSHRSRHSNKIAKSNGKEMHHDHGKIKSSYDYGEDCHSSKRKRFH
ncbi:E3 ubiquitin ligase PARAQUAT TOLERANCE 3 isoform X2 [Beta vulgaris subsp. vulgaris]|nr:E3 ubiquitin ligase PARAQUAT TOLERANCE 3 isoform X2 [Beta vulgaris subsp. vulgaris]